MCGKQLIQVLCSTNGKVLSGHLSSQRPLLAKFLHAVQSELCFKNKLKTKIKLDSICDYFLENRKKIQTFKDDLDYDLKSCFKIMF